VKSAFEIAGRRVGRGQPCYVIAEAGVNHNCDLALGKRLVETASSAGADAIKFQSYTASKISTRVAPRYWFEPKDPNGSQWDTFDKLDKLSDTDFKALLQHAHAAGLTVIPWTANSPQDWDRLIAAGVDAIITDDPAALIAHLKR